MRTATERPPRGRLRVLACALLAGLALGACSGDDDAETEAPTSAAPTAQDRLEQAQEVLAGAGTVHLGLAGEGLPEEESSYVIAADGSGTMEPPAFEGTITAKIAGIQADVPTIAVGDTLYVKMPFTPAYAATSPEDLNVPDPARIFDPEQGVVSLLGVTEDAEFGDQSRSGSEIVQEVTGTLPGDAIADLLGVGDREADFAVTYGLVEDDWQLRTAVITGPFYPPAESAYTLTLDAYGEPVSIEAP